MPFGELAVPVLVGRRGRHDYRLFMFRGVLYRCAFVAWLVVATYAAEGKRINAGQGTRLPLDLADHSTAKAWTAHRWTAEDGLPQNSVTSIAQTSDGYLWLGTFGGLVRFDGRTFTLFSTSNTPGLSNNRVTALCVDHSGRLWTGAAGGNLSTFENGKFESVEIPVNDIGGSVCGIVEDEERVVWVVSTRIARFIDGRLQSHVGEQRGRPYRAVFTARDGPVTARFRDRCFRLRRCR